MLTLIALLLLLPLSLTLVCDYCLSIVDQNENLKMAKDKKTHITRDVIIKSNGGVVHARNSETGRFIVSVKWGYKTYSDTITEDKIHRAFKSALEKDSSIGKKI